MDLSNYSVVRSQEPESRIETVDILAWEVKPYTSFFLNLLVPGYCVVTIMYFRYKVFDLSQGLDGNSC